MKELILYILNLFKSIFLNRFILLPWSIIYIGLCWVILKTLFGFNILYPYHWKLLLYTWKHGWVYHGFIDITFCTILLTSIPIYISTCIMMCRGKWWDSFKTWIPIISIPALKKDTNTNNTSNDTKKEIPEKNINIPNDLPTELSALYIQNTENGVSDKIIETKVPEEINEEFINQDNPIANEMLPKDFNIQIPNDNSNDEFLISETENQDINSISNNEETKFTINSTNTENADKQKSILNAIKELEKLGFSSKLEENLIISDKGNKHYVISVHDNQSMWITNDSDLENSLWCTEGEFIKSPAFEALNKTNELNKLNNKNNYQAILYIPNDNILDIDEANKIWDSHGIKRIKKLSELK